MTIAIMVFAAACGGKENFEHIDQSLIGKWNAADKQGVLTLEFLMNKTLIMNEKSMLHYKILDGKRLLLKEWGVVFNYEVNDSELLLVFAASPGTAETVSDSFKGNTYFVAQRPLKFYRCGLPPVL